jgi:hypothetical protein
MGIYCEVLILVDRLRKKIDIPATDSGLYCFFLKNIREPR